MKINRRLIMVAALGVGALLLFHALRQPAAAAQLDPDVDIGADPFADLQGAAAPAALTRKQRRKAKRARLRLVT